MAINFPTSLDSLTNPSATSDTATLSHAGQHSDVNDAIEALEAKVGVNSSAVTSTLDYKLTSASSSNPGHLHTLTAGVSGILPVANGGTNASSASITAFNNITGYTAAGATGTTSTNLVFSTSPTLTTPVLGAATATSINGLTLTSSTGTLTVTNGKTLTVSDSTTLATNSITLAGGEVITFSATNALSLLTGGTSVMTFPTATDTVAVLGTAQTYTATETHKQINWTDNAITASGNAATVPITHRSHTVTNNSAATLTITMTTTSAVNGQLSMVRILDASAAAQTITWVNTENSTVSAPTTSNGSTTLPLTVGFQYNSATSKWRCIASA